jgi:excisionase family DNA binding protein
MKRSREERSIEERVLNLEISNLYRSLTSRVIEIYEEQKRKPEQRSTSDESFDIHEAARRLGVSNGLVRKQVRERRLRHHRIGRLLRFSQQDIDDFISAQKTEIRGTTPRTSKKPSATRQVGEAAQGSSYGVSRAVPNPSLAVGEVAQILGCSPRTVHKLCNDGKLEFHWVRDKRKFRPEDVDDYRASNKLTPQPKNPKGGDQKGSRQERKATEVSIARRLRQLVEEMREW